VKKIAIIGDFNPSVKSHQFTNQALENACAFLQHSATWSWISTTEVEAGFEQITRSHQGFLIAPGSPYKSMEGALQVIEFARTHNIPTLGTCGGFQHMVIEFSRNALNIKDAQHAELDPYASSLVITPLSCNLKERPLEIKIIKKTSKTFAAIGTDSIYEKYYCNFGLNPCYQKQLQDHGFVTVGSDSSHEARIVELQNHPFFIATLFLPQDRSIQDGPHPLFIAFLQAVSQLPF